MVADRASRLMWTPSPNRNLEGLSLDLRNVSTLRVWADERITGTNWLPIEAFQPLFTYLQRIQHLCLSVCHEAPLPLNSPLHESSSLTHNVHKTSNQTINGNYMKLELCLDLQGCRQKLLEDFYFEEQHTGYQNYAKILNQINLNLIGLNKTLL